MRWKLYQVMINDERHDQVNIAGWDGVPWGSAYLNVSGCLDEDGAFYKVLDAALHDLYEETVHVTADEPEDVFRLCNLWNDESRVERLTRPKSMSVGDVILNVAETQGFVCLSCGFMEMTQKQTRMFKLAMEKE